MVKGVRGRRSEGSDCAGPLVVSVGEARKGQGHLEGGLVGWGESWQGTAASRLNGSRKETSKF